MKLFVILLVITIFSTEIRGGADNNVLSPQDAAELLILEYRPLHTVLAEAMANFRYVLPNYPRIPVADQQKIERLREALAALIKKIDPQTNFTSFTRQQLMLHKDELSRPILLFYINLRRVILQYLPLPVHPAQGQNAQMQHPQGQNVQVQQPHGQNVQVQQPQGQNPQVQHPQGQNLQGQYVQGQNLHVQNVQGQVSQGGQASQGVKRKQDNQGGREGGPGGSGIRNG